MTFRNYIPILLFVVLTFGGCLGGYQAPPHSLHSGEHTAHIVSLPSLAEMGPFDEVTIKGQVTANDLGGNFYKSIVVEDETGAVEVCLDSYELSALYPVGCWVVVDLDGLWAQEYDGVMQVGRMVYDWSDYRVEPIATRREIDLRVGVCGLVEECEPMEVAPSELTDALCGRLVRVGPLSYAGDEDKGWGEADYGSTCDHLFLAADGTRVAVRTSSYADFASVGVPQRELFITGILYRDRLEGEQRFVLKMRTLNDVE